MCCTCVIQDEPYTNSYAIHNSYSMHNYAVRVLYRMHHTQIHTPYIIVLYARNTGYTIRLPGVRRRTAPGTTVVFRWYWPHTSQALQEPVMHGGFFPQVPMGTARMSFMLKARTRNHSSCSPVEALYTRIGSPPGACLASWSTTGRSMFS